MYVSRRSIGLVARHSFPRFTSSSRNPQSSTGENGSSTTGIPRPFKDIPGPRGLPFVGTALEYAKSSNKYRMTQVIERRVAKYGTIYREKLMPIMPEQVVICNPQDVETVFRADGQWPNRPIGGEAFHNLRKAAKMQAGILLSQGENWHHQRQPMSKFTMVPRKVGEYHMSFNAITQDLLKNVLQLRDPETKVFSDLPKLLFKWSFESVAYFILERRLGCLEAGQIPPDCKAFIDAVDRLFKSIFQLVFAVPFHLLWESKLWKEAVDSMTSVNNLAMKFINERMQEITEEEKRALEDSKEVPREVDFLTYLVHSEKMSPEELSTNTVDLLMAGVETTSYTLSWVLYCLATNPDVQHKLRKEVMDILGSDDIVTPTHISKMPYLHSCVKETMRLYPLTGFNQRQLQQDVVLSGYRVPKGTQVTMPVSVMGRISQNFPEPERFLPERWSRQNKDTLPNMFASLPFGFGTRMCLGRRIAELEMYIALSHIMKNFSVEFPEKAPMDYIQKGFVIPERQLNLIFHDLIK